MPNEIIDRRLDLEQAGIPGTPNALFLPGASPSVIVGLEQPLENIDFGDLTRLTWWEER